MADRTHTSSPALTATLKAAHTGVNAVPVRWSSGGKTFEASDLVYLAKVPRGATIVGLTGAGWSGSADSTVVKVGLQGLSDDYLIANTTLSNTATASFTVRAGALPVTVTRSDDAANQFRYIEARVVSAATATTTAKLNLVVQYVMDHEATL